MPELPKRFKTREEYENLPEEEKWRWVPTFWSRFKKYIVGIEDPDMTYCTIDMEDGKMWVERHPRISKAMWGTMFLMLLHILVTTFIL